MNALKRIFAWARGACLTLQLARGGAALAQGVIYYTPEQPTYYSIGYPGTLDFNLDINRDGTADFILRSNDPGTSVQNAWLLPLGNNAFVNLSSFVANMNPGDTVGSSLNPVYYWSIVNAPISAVAALPDPPYGVELGNFVGQATGYIGLDLMQNGAHHYGWLHISSPITDAAIYGDVTGWAYQSSPNTPIAVGAVPETSVWALLLLGMGMLGFWKRRAC